MISAFLGQIDIFTGIKTVSDEALDSSPLLNKIGEAVDEAFLNAVQKSALIPTLSRRLRMSLSSCTRRFTGRASVR